MIYVKRRRLGKLSDLQPFKEPTRPEREACASCDTFAPECLVPVGDAAVPMCWLCAHHVTAHDTAPHRAARAECDCTPQEIYPRRMFDPPGTLLAVAAVGQDRTRRQSS